MKKTQKKSHTLKSVILAIIMFFAVILSASKCGGNNPTERKNDTSNESQYPDTVDDADDVYFGPDYYGED